MISAFLAKDHKRLWQYSFPIPLKVGGRVGLGGWLATYQDNIPRVN